MSRKQSDMNWWYYHGDNVTVLLTLSGIIGAILISFYLVDILYTQPIIKEKQLKEDMMYKELCQDERFYYLDSHAQECYKRGIRK